MFQLWKATLRIFGTAPEPDLEQGVTNPGVARTGVWSGPAGILMRMIRPHSSQAEPAPSADLWWRNTRVRQIQPTPSGWPRLGAFVDSDPNFRIFRRFGFLRTRLILYHQDILTIMEQDLDRLDLLDHFAPETRRYLNSRIQDDSREYPSRKQLFKELKAELETYDALVKSAAEMYERNKANEHARRQVANFIWNDHQLEAPDRTYIEHIDDLFLLHGDADNSWVHDAVYQLLIWIPLNLRRKIFRTSIQARKVFKSTLDIELREKKRYDSFVNVVFTLIIVVLVMGPVMNLYGIKTYNGYVQNATAMAWTASFSLLCSTATNASRHEVFAVTAAYCAVLVVFTSQNT